MPLYPPDSPCPVFRHAMLRVPGIALPLAALGFQGLAPNQPSPEWGLIPAERVNYVERAPLGSHRPGPALVLASILAVSLGREAPERQMEPRLSLAARLRWGMNTELSSIPDRSEESWSDR